MKVNNILFDSSFEKRFKKYKEKLTSKQKEQLKQKLIIFKNNIFDDSLKTHKLSGKFCDYYSFRLSYKDRLRFKLLGDGDYFLGYLIS